MNRPPKSLTIIGKTYSIQPDDDMDLAGHMNPRLQEIRYESSRAPQEVQDTILHETIHAIDYNMQLKLSERQVHVLASSLLQVLWDNPALARFLMKRA